MNNYKFGTVSLIGLSNVGKSTLFNKLTGSSISIVHKTLHTTQKLVTGVLTMQNFQAVFIDSPGYQKNSSALINKYMLSQTIKSIKLSDLIIFVTTPHLHAKLESEEVDLINQLSKFKKPLIFVLNKTENIPQPFIQNKLHKLKTICAINSHVNISAKLNQNIDQLLQLIYMSLPIGEPQFSKESLTSNNLNFLLAEIVRESALAYIFDEIPYGIATATEHYIEKKSIIKILVYIYVTKKSHLPILIGNNGNKIKKIGILARSKIEKLVHKQVFLELSVKILEKWESDNHKLKFLGFN